MRKDHCAITRPLHFNAVDCTTAPTLYTLADVYRSSLATRPNRRYRAPPAPTYRLNPLSCHTVLGSLVEFFSASQTGSTSGPSMSPAPSQPQHQTYGGGSLKLIGSDSSCLNRRSCGPNHDRSWGSDCGSSGWPPSLAYARMTVKLRRAG